MAEVRARVDGPIATIAIDNPTQRGALTPEMLATTVAHLHDFAAHYPAIRVVVLRGAGDTFSSGYAIDRIPEPDDLAPKDIIEELCEVIESEPVVVIAMLRGAVVGAAFDIAAACDFRLAEHGTRLGITPAKLGLVYTAAGTARIHRAVGGQWARLLFYTGDLVDAERAAQIGFVLSVHPGPSDLERAVYALAENIVDRAPLSVAGAKRVIAAIEHVNVITADVAADLDELRRNALRSPDTTEARAAFAEKRRPRFVRGAP